MKLTRFKLAFLSYALFDLLIGGHCGGLLPLGSMAAAQQGQAVGNITSAATTCSTTAVPTNCVILQLDAASGAASIDISGTWAATLQIEAFGGVTWAAINCTPPNSTTAVSSTTANGVWQCNVAGFSSIRVRASAYTSGTAAVVINSAHASAKSGGGAVYASGLGTVNGIPKGNGANQLADSAVTDNTATGGYVASTGAISAVGGLATTALATPTAPVATCAGACAGGTWSYKVIAYDANGFQTVASSIGSATNATTLTTTNKNNITWSAVTNAASYKLVRTASAGTPANLSLLCTVSTGSPLTCTDDGSINTATFTIPTTNATGGILLPNCTFNSAADTTNAGLWPMPTGISNGHIGTGLCFTSAGNMWYFNPTHIPTIFFGAAITYKWSQEQCWSPNGTLQDAGNGVCISGSTGQGFDSSPGMLTVGWNNAQNAPASYVGAQGYSVTLTATAALTAGQVVKVDSANDSSIVVAATTDTAAGIPLGIVLNSPGAAGMAYVLLQGKTALPLLGTGTCTLGQFVIVDTTTNGRVKCTGTYTAGTIIGDVVVAQAVVGSAVTMVVRPR